MAGRSTRRNTANNTNPPNEIADEVTRQLNTALPNLLTQLVQALGGNRANQREVTQSCSIKTFRASGDKEFFGTEGVVGLLTWFESIEFLLMEEYCLDDEIQKLETEFWNHKMVGSYIDGYTARFHELARLVPHMVTPENQCVNRYIRGLAPEIKAHVTSSKPTSIQSVVSMANRLTIDGIKDGIFKKKENTGNKKRRKDKGNVSMLGHIRSVLNAAFIILVTAMCAVDVTKWATLPDTAQGRAFALGVVEAPQDPNVVTSTFSLNDHFATVLFDSGVDYSFISTNFLPFINMKPSVISPGYEIEIASGLKGQISGVTIGGETDVPWKGNLPRTGERECALRESEAVDSGKFRILTIERKQRRHVTGIICRRPHIRRSFSNVFEEPRALKIINPTT
ncbi:putative reverse transcriptase domain-containing protein [Tanacetum coccineum]|uniref:Reverse transcriptase domain-containing protein n=1 Tax=Tanacetum coccineum TaxID=301880 RepID=A0ABQ5FNE2_9ASTR